jgi:hypothetical protein
LGTVLPFGIPWEAPAVDKKPTVPDIIMMAGGAVCLLFSFFAFWKFGSSSESAWGQFAFPLATYVALFGIIVGGSIALMKFANVNFPEPILSFTWKQIRLALSIFAALIMIGFLLLNTPAGLDKGIGFWFMFLGAAALVVGSVMETIGFNPQPATGGGGAAPGASPPAPPPPPGSPPPPPPSA